MKILSLTRTAVLALALGGMVLAPALTYAQGRGNSSKNKHWNAAPPKKNGRHDNRDWNKKGDRRSDDWRSDGRYRDDDRCDDDRNRNGDWRSDDRYRNDDWRTDDRYRNDGRYDDWRYRDSEYDRRQQTKNEWRNIAYLSGAAAILGLLKDDKTLTFGGAAGALYSLYRYEQDRKSQNRLNRLRATYFDQPYFYRDGERYDRRLVERNGQQYYQFCRAN